MDKGLLFFIISLIAFWLVLDQIYGNQYITQFVTNIIPSSSKEWYGMERFYKDFGFIISFLVLTLVIQISLGTEFTNKFLVLVLLGMILTNYDKFNTLLQNSFTVKED